MKGKHRKPPPPARAALVPRPRPLSAHARAVLLLACASGFCALAYQIAWQREFRSVFGASTAASAAVIAVFMAGLGVGSRFFGPRLDRSPNALAYYARLEAGIALAAATTPLLLEGVRRVYLASGGSAQLGFGIGTILRLVLATLVLLPPTFLAGGTLGAAARAIEPEDEPSRQATAWLYGINTLGAALGCVTATFWMLEGLGTRGTLGAAAAVNLCIAGVAAVLSRSQPAPPDGSAAPSTGTGAPPPSARIVLASAVLVGFTFFLMELVWYRMLGPILGGTVYTFGLVLAMALLGIAAGGVLYPRLVPTASLTALGSTCVAEAALIAVPYLLGDKVAFLALALRPEAGASLASYLPGWLLVTAIVVLPASLVAGAQFPLLIALLGSGRRGLASHVGRAYAFNTAGGIVGALAGGFGLLPALSAPGCWRLSALLLGGLGAAVAWCDRSRPRLALPATLAGVGALATALLVVPGPTAAWRHSGIGVGRTGAGSPSGENAARAFVNDARRSLVREREGIESSVAIQAVAGYSFVLNGKVDGNARNDAPTQVMGGLIGPLLAPGARRSLVIGLGTGSTAGWLAQLPGMERTDVVELEPAVVEVARLCVPVNYSALDNPRVRVRIGDAREVLMTGRERYDLMFSEPSNPYRAGVASLFTREFYEAAKRRLSRDGLFLQWLQAYEVDEDTVSSILATMAAVFPAVEVWQVHHIDMILIGSERPLSHDLEGVRQRMREEPFASALRHAWRAQGVEDVFARFVAGPGLARRLHDRGHRINSDDRNRAEFAFARNASGRDAFDVPRLRRAARAAGADRPLVAGELDFERVERRRLDVYTLAGYAPPIEVDAPPHAFARRRAHAEYAAGNLKEAVAAFRQQPLWPESALETALFAEGLAEAGDTAALPHIQALRGLSNPEAESIAARLALRLGQHELARDALVASLVHYRSDPWPSQIVMARALALAQELAAARPEMAPFLVEALARPFAVAALEEPRRLVRLLVSAAIGGSEACRDALAELEPHVPWREDVLGFRARCYAATHDPLARAAAADLAAFRRAVPPPRPSR